MTLIYQRKKATVAVELPPGEVDQVILVSSTPVNAGNQTVNFTDATGDSFIVFTVGSTSAVPTVSFNGSNTAATSNTTGQHSYNTSVWLFKATTANLAIALGNVNLGSWVVHRIRGRNAPVTLTLRTFGLGSANGATGGLTSTGGAAGSLVVLWDRDVEGSVQPLVDKGTRLHNYRYTYFQGLLQHVPSSGTTAPAINWSNMINTYGFYYCHILVNPA